MKVLVIFLVLVVFYEQQCCAFKKCRGDKTLEGQLVKSAKKASRWLNKRLDQQPSQDDFHINSAAVHALRLAGFDSKIRAYQTSVMSRHNGGQLGLHINGMIASCHRPSRKLTKLLIHCTETPSVKCGLTHPFQYLTAVLALCNSGHRFGRGTKNIALNRTEQIMSHYLKYSLDTVAMAMITQSCIRKRICNRRLGETCGNKLINNTVHFLLGKQKKDGSFGKNSITTALVIQALLSQGVPADRWYCSLVMRYLMRQQKEDGCFGGLMATIQVLPVLQGAVLSDYERLEQRCKQHNTIAIDNRTQSQLINRNPVAPNMHSEAKAGNLTIKLVVNVTGKFECHYDVIVANGSSALDVLHSTHKNLTQDYDELCDDDLSLVRTVGSRYGRYLQAVGRYEEDSVRHIHWLMYIDDGSLATVGVDSYFPRNGTQLTFKFESTQ